MQRKKRARVLRCKTILLAILAQAALCHAQREFVVRFLGTAVGDSTSGIRLAEPLGMSVDQEGNIYLADTGNHRVLKCDTQGKLVREVGGFGFGEQQFDRPVDVWVDNGLNVFVADYDNHRLQRYDKDLNFISAYASDDALDESLRFGYPAAVAVSAQGEMFVADHEFNRVLRFEALGNPKASFGDFNWGEGRLERPAKILISRRNEIWVSDSLRHALMKYDAFGNFSGSFLFDKETTPSGLAEWEHGMIVVDRKQHRLLFLNKEGERLSAFGKRGNGIDEFERPVAVLVPPQAARAHSARLLVLDSGNNRVQRFEVQWPQ